MARNTKMKKIIYLMLIISSYGGYAQNSYDVKSPNVSDFIRYGNIPIKMYTGELDTSIPLLSVPLANQAPINLSLSYNASGFIPNKRPDVVGLNWNINGIGVITREIKGVPDDHIGAPTTLNGINGRYAHGFMVGIKYMKDAGGNLPNGVVINKVYNVVNNSNDAFCKPRFVDSNSSATNSFETTPDVFHFNVNDISGTFFMTSDGKIKVISNTPDIINVDIANFNFQPYTVDCAPINSSEIKIIDKLGNKYYFGGESKFLEYTLSSDGSRGSMPVINTWWLKRIEYYNGEIINYNYQDDAETSGFCSYDSGFIHGANDERKKFVFINESVNDTRYMERVGGITNSTGGAGHFFTLHKKAFLDNISGTNFTIKFNYSSQGYVFNNNSNLYSFYKPFNEFKLDNIILKYNTQEIKKIELNYSLKGGVNAVNSYPRLFLDAVKEVGKMPYSFEYDIQANQLLPKPSTCGVDFWGFYNGKPNDAPPFGYDQLIAQSTVDANGDETFISNIRNSNFNFAKIGILKKIIYPTGGYSEFEYEPHTYGKRLDRKSIGSFLPALYDVTGEVGGVRIKKTTDFDGVQNTNVKEYIYTKSDNTSSGILMQWPRSQLVYKYQNYVPHCSTGGVFWASYSTEKDIAAIQSSSININSVENSVINYSRVVERSLSNGYSVYNFKDYLNYPDINDFSIIEKPCSVSNLCGVAGTEYYTPENLVKNLGLILNDKSIERGKLSSKWVYNNNNVLIKKEEYLYNTDPNRFNFNSQFAGQSMAWWYGGKQYFYNDFLTDKKITQYNNVGNIITTEKSIYTSAPNYSTLMSNQDVLSKTNFSSSVNNELLETEYKYPYDTYTAGSTDYINFRDANIYSSLREIQYRNGSKLSEKFSLLGKDASTNNKLNLKNSYSAKFPNSNPILPNGIGQLEKKSTYDFYDTQGNVTQYTTENGATVSIIWGYSKTLPIAKIENATLAQLATALGTSTTTLQTYNESNLLTINSLRNSLPNAMVTTYTHLPLIGVSTITDPKGDVSTYTYDSVGRLLNIKDKNGNVLSEYKYHYKNQ